MPTRRQTLQTSAAVLATAMIDTPSSPAAPPQHEEKFWLPEESGPHSRTFMQWPVSPKVHPDPVFLGRLQQSIADIANAIAAFEPVVMLMDLSHRRVARAKLAAEVEIWQIELTR